MTETEQVIYDKITAVLSEYFDKPNTPETWETLYLELMSQFPVPYDYEVKVDRLEIKDYIKLPYSRVLIPEESGGYSCSVLEFPGCFSQGETLEESMNNINEAMECWIEACLDSGQDIPTPFITDEKLSVTVRLSRDEYQRLVKAAYRDKVNIEEFVYNLILNNTW
jgi:antitoxin HicB